MATHPRNGPARKWYEVAALSAGDLVFGRQTEIGFLRLITQAVVMNKCSAAPLSNSEAITLLAGIHRDPAVSRTDEPESARSLWLELANLPQPSPNYWMDAYLAAFAITLGAEMVTFDRGFASFQSRGLNLLLLSGSWILRRSPSR